jgi:hypothetical protein
MKRLALLSSVLFFVMVTSAAVAATPPEPNHWWKLDETSGTIAYDSVDGKDGTFNGDNPCWTGDAVDLNGVSDYFSVSSLDSSYTPYFNTFSVAGWFKTSQSTGMQTIVGDWSQYGFSSVPGQYITLYFGWQVLVENNKVVARFGPASTTPYDITGTSNVTDGEWHHFALVFPNQDSNTVLYVDGQPEGTPEKRYGYNNNIKFRIGDGSMKTGSEEPILKGGPFNGMIDDVMVFNRILTAEEVSASASENVDWRFNIASLVAHWLDTPCAEPDWCEGADVSRDGIVNFTDYTYAAGNTYETAIYTCEQLQGINGRYYVENGDYYLADDINCSCTREWNDGAGFTPIGDYHDPYTGFTGTLDGRGHKISNLYINRPASDCVGLFSTLKEGGKILNLGLLNVNITGRYHTGGLVGNYDSPFWYDTDSEINNCYVTGNITGATYPQSFTGGLVGYLRGQIKQSYSYVNLSCFCVSYGQQYTGGLVGYNYSGEIENCYARGTVWGNNFLLYAGGLVGFNSGGVTNSYSTTFIAPGQYAQIGGLIASTQQAGTCVNSFWDTETSGLTYSSGGTGKTTSEMKDQSTFESAGWNFEVSLAWFWYIDPPKNSGYPYIFDRIYRNDPAEFVINNIWYVDDNAAGIQCGRSWETAFKYLRDALINPYLKAGDEIRAAQGTYKPDRDKNHPNGTGECTATFQLINGVTVKGGYAGLGAANPDSRDVKNCPTVLSGDIGIEGDQSDNSYHVVTGSGTDANAIFDGFTITRGNARGPYSDCLGGGMFCGSGSLTIRNCNFVDNSAHGGAGIILMGHESSPGLTPIIENCKFVNNAAAGYGGGIAILDNSFSVVLTLTNCIFSNNSAQWDGGGMSLASSNSIITNCTFNSNVSSLGQGGGISNNESSPVITNCIFWNNNGSEIYNTGASNPVVTYCDIQGGYSGSGNINSNPLFLNDNDPLNHGLQLRTGSLCIDAANGSAAPLTDMLGQERIDIPGIPNATPIPADMGAYEKMITHIWYVDSNFVDATGNGTSWETAFKYLQDAFAVANYDDEIRAARGTYKPDRDKDHEGGTSNRTSAFQLINAVSVKGGYKGGDSLTGNERNIKIYQTILSGDLLGNDGNPPDFANYGDNSYHVVTGSNTNPTAILDGFTITGGNANGSDAYYGGGGMYNYTGSPTVANCIFYANRTDGMGGGMYNSGIWNSAKPGSSPRITNCVFTNNQAVYSGGGIYNYWDSNPIITNCVFSNNSAVNFYGGGISNFASAWPTIINCTFYGNSAGRYGGSIDNNTHCDGMIVNCIFWGNYAGTGGSEISNRYAYPTVSYCDIKGGLNNSPGCYGAPSTNGGGNINSSPLFADANNPDGNDGMFYTLDDGLRLREASPCIDTANDSIAPDKDISGFFRVDIPDIGLTGVQTDMGAYEYVSGVPLTIVMCFTDESTQGYHKSGGLALFDANLSAYAAIVSSLQDTVKSGCFVPLPSGQNGTNGNINDVLPIGYTYDSNNPPEGISIEQFPRSPKPTITDFQDRFNNLRESYIPMNVIFCIDYSGSMTDDEDYLILEPVYSQFKAWITTEFPGTNIYTDDNDDPLWTDELWVSEITRMIQNNITP